MVASMSQTAAELEALFVARKATIGVIGLGYVGLPLACAVADAGFGVIGFDIDPEKVASLNSGRSYLRHISDSVLAARLGIDRFSATADFQRLAEADAVLICVPTPLTSERKPDLSMVESTAREISRFLRPGQLVVLESTTYPGTCTDVVLPILCRSGLTNDRDFFLAYSPEREDPGNSDYSTAGIPKVVGADSSDAIRVALAFYRQVVIEVIAVTSTATAEAVKLTENVFRAANIALVNELKIAYAAMDVDIWEVINAAKTKPFGYMAFYPGPGLGGHCIPIDPFYLTWKAQTLGVATRLVALSGEINSEMPEVVVARLSACIRQVHQRDLAAAQILLIGVAYKKNVDDVRESPALHIWDLLEAQGAVVSYHDPIVTRVPATRKHNSLEGKQSVALSAETLEKYDAALIVTDHDDVDYRLLVEHCPVVVDTRNICDRLGMRSANVFKA